MILSHADARE